MKNTENKKPMDKQKYAQMIKQAYDKKRVEAERKLQHLSDPSVEEIEEALKEIQRIDGAEYRLLNTLTNVVSKNDPNG